MVRYAVDSGEEESRAVKTGARETGIDLERFRLRRFVEELRQTGELEVHAGAAELAEVAPALEGNAKADRKSTRLNSSHLVISYAVFCLKKKNEPKDTLLPYPTGGGRRLDAV